MTHFFFDFLLFSQKLYLSHLNFGFNEWNGFAKLSAQAATPKFFFTHKVMALVIVKFVMLDRFVNIFDFLGE